VLILGIALTLTLILLAVVRIRAARSADLGEMGHQWVAANNASRTSSL
jgi:hypothetical protein